MITRRSKKVVRQMVKGACGSHPRFINAGNVHPGNVSQALAEKDHDISIEHGAIATLPFPDAHERVS